MKKIFQNSDHRGDVFYDAECGLCTQGAVRWGKIFERRGFRWLPLQTKGNSANFPVADFDLATEMKLLLPDGRVIGGVSAWRVLFHSVWWLWPFSVLLSLPGMHFLSAGMYRWIARHRQEISRACGLPPPSTHHRHKAFLELP